MPGSEVIWPRRRPDLGSLAHKVDIAMYKAKLSGNGHHIYRSVHDADDAIRPQMVEELPTALPNDRLIVHYQPTIDLNTGDVHSMEPLVRWDHPTRGLLHPDAFLDVTEDAGLMRTPTQVCSRSPWTRPRLAHRRPEADHRGQPPAGFLVDADLPEQVADMLAAPNCRRVPRSWRSPRTP